MGKGLSSINYTVYSPLIIKEQGQNEADTCPCGHRDGLNNGHLQSVVGLCLQALELFK